MSHFPSKAELQIGVEAVATESGGLLVLDAVRAKDVPHLLTDALFGDPEALALVGPVTQTMARVANAPKHKPALCVSCPRAVRPGGRFAVAIARAAIDSPTKALGFIVCDRCGRTPGAIRAAAAYGIKGIFPESRMVEPTHTEAGHA